MEREIWFERILWSYMPCHWKGWAAMAALIAVTFCLLFLGGALLKTLGIRGADDLPFLIIFPAVVVGQIVARRHS